MRALKLAISAAILFFALPVFIVGILGLLFSPLQTMARATEPNEVLEANDLMLSEAVKEQVAQWESAPDSADSHEAGQMQERGAEAPFDSSDEVAAGHAPEQSDDAAAFEELPSGSGSPQGQQDAAFSGDPSAVQASAESAQWLEAPESGIEEPAVLAAQGADTHYSSDQLLSQGVIQDGGYRYTWYSQRVLPGGGLNIEGRHVSQEGYVVDAQERIVLASSDLPYGTEVSIPFGSGRGVVLDTGCDSGTLDVYTNF